MEEQLATLKQELTTVLSQAQTLEELEKVRIDFLGKKGKLSKILASMGKLSAEERPRMGALANEVKTQLQTNLEERKTALEDAALEAQIAAETLDVTMPGPYIPIGRVHPLQSTIDRILDIFVAMGYTVVHGPEIETEYYNFEALNTPEDHPARDMQDTLYLEDGYLLRTQTSSVQVRYMEAHTPPLQDYSRGASGTPRHR